MKAIRFCLFINFIALLILSCKSYEQPALPSFPEGNNITMDFILADTPYIVSSGQVTLLHEISLEITDNIADVDKWILYLPDNIPIQIAIDLFEQFVIAECNNLSVYSMSPNGLWSETELGLSLTAFEEIQIIALFLMGQPDVVSNLQKGNYPYPLYAAYIDLMHLEDAISPIVSLIASKHVRIHENGGFNGLQAELYFETLKTLEKSGVEYVSFFGVYLE